MKIAHSSPEIISQSLIGEGGESLLCEKEEIELNNKTRYVSLSNLFEVSG